MTSEAAIASDVEFQRDDSSRSNQATQTSGAAASSPFRQSQESSKRRSSDMLLSPSPAGQRLPNTQALRSPYPLQSLGNDPAHVAEHADLWEAASAKEEGLKKRQPCSFFLKTGNCAFGAECKFEHPLDQPATQYNSLGLPLRPGEPDCAYYVKNLHCGYGGSCKFHHAEPVIGWMPVMSENMGMHHSMMGYSQLGSMPSAGLPGNFPMHMPLMHQNPHQMQMVPQPANLTSSGQYNAQMRPFMHLSMPTMLPPQHFMQMRMPASPPLVHQPQSTLPPGSNSLLFQGLPQRVPRREVRGADTSPAFTSDSSGSSRPVEVGRSRRRGRGRGLSHASPSNTFPGVDRTPSGVKLEDARRPSRDGDLVASAFSAMSLEGQR